jgi:diadenosine tetraphosphate (Ap4A) HIT family hydrolase
MNATSCALCKWVDGGTVRAASRFVGSLSASHLFIYPDQSYAGRMALVMSRHEESLDSLSREEHGLFCDDLRVAVQVMRLLFPHDRINLALLGNREPHLHWHLIPRRPGDHNDGEAPWPHPEVLADEEHYRGLAQAAAHALSITIVKRSD